MSHSLLPMTTFPLLSDFSYLSCCLILLIPLTRQTGSATQNLSLVLDPRGRTHSLSSLKAEGAEVVEHDAVGPDVMSKLTQDLESPDANPRAAELFAKRKSMSKGKRSTNLTKTKMMNEITFVNPLKELPRMSHLWGSVSFKVHFNEKKYFEKCNLLLDCKFLSQIVYCFI